MRRGNIDIRRIRTALAKWEEKHGRPFPWRKTRNAYRILIAEILLHRTQARQVEPVYKNFIQKYPDIHSLALARNSELQRMLYPLGLHWRIPLMRQMAGLIEKRYAGRIPEDKQTLASLPGVSEYIASAFRCFACCHHEALIDTNTVRVVGRLYGIETRDSSRRNSGIKGLIEGLVDTARPKQYNYALLDLGNAVCHKARPPECDRCPLRAFCRYALEFGKPNSK